MNIFDGVNSTLPACRHERRFFVLAVAIVVVAMRYNTNTFLSYRNNQLRCFKRKKIAKSSLVVRQQIL